MSSSPLMGNALVWVGTGPTLIALLIGVAVSIAYWQRAPRVALLALLGFGLELLAALGGPLSGMILPFLFRSGWAMAPAALAVGTIGVILSILRAVGIGLLIAAIFQGRSTTA